MPLLPEGSPCYVLWLGMGCLCYLLIPISLVRPHFLRGVFLLSVTFPHMLHITLARCTVYPSLVRFPYPLP